MAGRRAVETPTAVGGMTCPTPSGREPAGSPRRGAWSPPSVAPTAIGPIRVILVNANDTNDMNGAGPIVVIRVALFKGQREYNGRRRRKKREPRAQPQWALPAASRARQRGRLAAATA